MEHEMVKMPDPSMTKENDGRDAISPKIDESILAEKNLDVEAKDLENKLGGKSIRQDSFKKPCPLIGPIRGKVGSSRAGGVRISAVMAEESSKDANRESVDDTVGEVRQAMTTTTIAVIDKQRIPLPYQEPAWAGTPKADYKMEVLKSGVIIEIIDISEKGFYAIGRSPTCDVSLAHPTISRYHAILQYREVADEKHPCGYYLYDLGSTHGTYWNGYKIKPNVYVRLFQGHIIKFGCSQRKFILQTPPQDAEEESEFTVTELKAQRHQESLEKKERAAKEEREREEEEKLRIEKEEREGIDWGMGEDADEETDLTENPYASTNNEELFFDDPKKTLRGWFEREGHELQYETEEKGVGQFLCWVDLPIDADGSGRTIRAEAMVKGKKKESVVQCALEACRILDRHGVLRQATHEAKKRKTRNWEEEDYYDSDEDNFLDRTGTIEKKRERRMREAGKLEKKIETYSSLLEKHKTVVKKIDDIEKGLKNSRKLVNVANNSSEDALDAFMSSLNSPVYDKTNIRKMKLELQNLRKEEAELLKLVDIAKPANLPSLTSSWKIPINNLDFAVRTGCDKEDASKKRSVDCDETAKFSTQVKRSLPDKKEIEKYDVEEQMSTDEEKNLRKTKISHKEGTGGKNIKDGSLEPDDNEASIARHDGDATKSENEIEKKKIKNIKRIQQRAVKATKESRKGYDAVAHSEDYSMWLPPENQSGDGKTSLNEKYGY